MFYYVCAHSCNNNIISILMCSFIINFSVILIDIDNNKNYYVLCLRDNSVEPLLKDTPHKGHHRNFLSTKDARQGSRQQK